VSEDLREALFEVATALNTGVDRQAVLEQIALRLRRLVPHTELLIGRADPVARVVIPVFAQAPTPSGSWRCASPTGRA
jgi:hypothetical protein